MLQANQERVLRHLLQRQQVNIVGEIVKHSSKLWGRGEGGGGRGEGGGGRGEGRGGTELRESREREGLSKET